MWWGAFERRKALGKEETFPFSWKKNVGGTWEETIRWIFKGGSLQTAKEIKERFFVGGGEMFFFPCEVYVSQGGSPPRGSLRKEKRGGKEPPSSGKRD